MSGEERRVCLLTGASGLLGSAFCRANADRYRIVAAWHTKPPPVASQTQRFIDPLTPDAPLEQNRHPVHSVRVDLTSAAQTRRLVERTLRRYGRIDLVVNAAAVRRWRELGAIADLRKDFDRHFAANVRAPLAVALEVVRQCWTADGGRFDNPNVVNLSSAAGLRVYPGYGQGMYSATKAALDFMTGHLAAELAPHGIRANALAPNTFPGIVSVERVLDGVCRLDEGTMTGQVLMLDAGGDRWFDLTDEPR